MDTSDHIYMIRVLFVWRCLWVLVNYNYILGQDISNERYPHLCPEAGQVMAQGLVLSQVQEAQACSGSTLSVVWAERTLFSVA